MKQELDKTMEQVRVSERARLGCGKRAGAFRSLDPGARRPARSTSFAIADYLADAGTEHAAGASREFDSPALMLGLDAREAGRRCSPIFVRRSIEIQLVSTLLERWRAFGATLVERARVAERCRRDAQVRAWVAAIGRLQVGSFMRAGVGRVGGGARARRAPRRRRRRFDGCTVGCSRSAFRDPIDLGALAVDGDDLRRSGIPPGPGLGKNSPGAARGGDRRSDAKHDGLAVARGSATSASDRSASVERHARPT